MSKSLFDIGVELLAIEDMIEAKDGVLDDEVDAYITKQLESLVKEQGDKSDGYIHLIRKMEMVREAAKTESQRYLRISQIQDAAADRLKRRLKEYMETLGLAKIETPTGRTIRVQKNGGLTPIIFLPDLDATTLPPKFQKMSVEVDGAAVRSALDSGEVLNFAEFGKRGTQLRISGGGAPASPGVPDAALPPT